MVALLLGPSKKIVAYGTVIVAGDKLHGAPMPEDCFRVSIDEVVDADAILPHRVSDEIDTVGSSLATHVAWPRLLVVERSDEVMISLACFYVQSILYIFLTVE